MASELLVDKLYRTLFGKKMFDQLIETGDMNGLFTLKSVYKVGRLLELTLLSRLTLVLIEQPLYQVWLDALIRSSLIFLVNSSACSFLYSRSAVVSHIFLRI